MDDWGIASAEQLAELTEILDEYAEEAGIVSEDTRARDRLARRILGLFNDGIVRPADIRRGLDCSPSQWRVEPASP
jgi:hypothetical protein